MKIINLESPPYYLNNSGYLPYSVPAVIFFDAINARYTFSFVRKRFIFEFANFAGESLTKLKKKCNIKTNLSESERILSKEHMSNTFD